MNHSRPKNLNLFTIRFPIPAIVSILHRVSGVFLFLLIPIVLWGLGVSLTESGFVALQQCFGSAYVKFILWILLIPFCYHFIAGIRHLLMDVGIGVTLKNGRIAAWLTFVIFAIVIVFLGVWLW